MAGERSRPLVLVVDDDPLVLREIGRELVLEVARGVQSDAVRLLISGAATPESVEEALRIGIAHSFVPKPWVPGAILRAIEG